MDVCGTDMNVKTNEINKFFIVLCWDSLKLYPLYATAVPSNSLVVPRCFCCDENDAATEADARG